MARDNQRDNQKAAAAGGENASEFKEKMVSLAFSPPAAAAF